MEYSPMMLVMLWALTPSDCVPTPIADSGQGEPARVVEMPPPLMSVHPEGGYFTFNYGRPFLAERDPLTGAVDSNIKTTPVTGDDYVYEEYEESGESIDRKDTTKIYSRNDITGPSKESDLHKFLNLPVHYSSSGKFPLISSSYANTKVQGHGPLSNHKLYSSSTSTSTTVSPSYYPLKTTPPSTTTPKVITTPSTTPSTTTSTTTSTTIFPSSTPSSTPATTTSLTTTSAASSATTSSSTFTATTSIISSTYSTDNSTSPSIPPVRSTSSSSTTSATTTSPNPASTKPKITTSEKPLSPYYEYEYDYDYDKNDGEATEKTSHDYEFLGASSEVTKPYGKPPNTNSDKPISTTHHNLLLSSKKDQTTETSSTPSTVSTTVRTVTKPATDRTVTTSHTLPNDKKPTPFTEKENLHESVTKKPEDIVDLRPPKPELSTDLRPPQLHPSRPYSSVLPLKHSNLGHAGFVRYPELPLTITDKKPISFYTAQNVSRTKPDSLQPISLPQKENRIKEEIKNPNHSVILKGEQSTISAFKFQDISKLDSATTRRTPIESHQDKPLKTNHQDKPLEKPQDFSSNKLKPQPAPTHDHKISQANPPTKPFSHLGTAGNLHGNPGPDIKRPQIVNTSEYNKPEELKHHGAPLKTEFVHPHITFSEQSKLQILHSPIHNRPPTQEHKLHQTIQGHAKPTESSFEKPIPQERPQRPQALHRPQSTIPENNRVKINPNIETRPQNTYQPQNKPPQGHYAVEHNRPPNYHMLDPNHLFGLRVSERPHPSEINRPPAVEHVRPPGVRIQQEGKLQPPPNELKKLPNNGVDGRPVQGFINGEVRPGDPNHRPDVNNKPIIFAKPQSGKRPDFNTVQFGQPSRVENHFISVSPGHENPSYSLQTSFSIGVPPPEQKQTPGGGSHGVGQVLFPDEEPEKRPPPPPPPPIWPHQHRPPPINQPDTHPVIQHDKYPRPPWETHLKPPHIYHKKEPFPPIKRKPLPNILPQFRPNAKLGHAEPHIYMKPREPYDTLQPPPLPRPQYLRIEEFEESKPLVHRRNGQGSSGTRVTTLQMMQGPPSTKRASLRIDDSNEKNEPVFVVYPSNGNSGPLPQPPAPAPAPAPSDGVVVGTRGPQRPLPPDNLDIGDDLDSFPLDNNKNFQARVDTPVLKSKPSTAKPPIKNEFPYTLIKPNPEDRETPANVVTKEYTAFSPTVASIEKEHDTEINIIPYLQDYMPFATKKPQNRDPWISGNEMKTISQTSTISEITQTPYLNENHRVVVVSEGPQPQDFQAPFHASLTAPSQGWSVVQKKPNKENSNNNNSNNNEEVTTIKEFNEIQTTEETKFDIQNFKPQLFGGFKPIVPPTDNENKEKLHII